MNSLLMLPVLFQAALATLMTYLFTLAGAALVLPMRRTREVLLDAMMAFGAGVMLASSFWSLLAPGIARAAEEGMRPWLVSAGGFLLGGAFLMLGDAALTGIKGPADGRKKRLRMLIASITLHNIPEGLAVGVAFGALAHGGQAAVLRGAWLLALGIAVQNFPEGAAVSLPLRREGFSRGRAFWYGQLSGAVEPVAGVIGALLATAVRRALPFLMCFAGGAMVMVVVAELVPESQRSSCAPLMTAATMAGFALMMVLDVAF